MVEVQSLRNHLRPDKNIRFSLFEIRNYTLVSRTRAGCVQVHTGNGRLRKQALDVILYLLRTKTAIAQIRPFTGRTDAGQLVGVSAIMACQLVQPLVICQTHITVLAFRHPSARMALYHRGKPSAVLKQDNLLFLLQSLTDILQQQRRERAVHPLLAL